MKTMAFATVVLAASQDTSGVAQLCDDYWQFLMRESPTWATRLGDHRYNDKLPDIAPEARDRRAQERKAFLDRIDKIAPASSADAITLDLLRRDLEKAAGDDTHRFWQWDLDHMYGPQVWLFQLANYHPVDKPEGRATFIKRLEAFPRYLEQYVANLRLGMKEGNTATKMATNRVVGQLKAHLAAKTEDWPIAKHGGEAAQKHVRPAFQKLLEFLEKEYQSRDEIGMSKRPAGLEAYAHLIRKHTSLDLTPQQLHDIGLMEMDSIEREMMKIVQGESLADYRTRISSDRANFCESREEYLERFRAILQRVEPQLARYFARRPSARYEVREIEAYREKDSVAAFYQPPPEDGSRPGIFYANCHKVHSRPKYNMAALAVHEAVPGHHLQIAFAQELKSLPKFRRHGGSTAYVEGWALYSERLAEEIGVYETDLERFGMLTYQAWRAARLVVDTGLHAKGWSRDRAIEYFKNHLALSDEEIVNEIDRYIIWPGQALAYKIGQRKIQDLRAKASQELGGKFRLPDFHVEVLRHGAVPLATLEKLVDLWIVEQKKKP